ncbi:unnamed protein product [Paramecium sonneborni]|uniref:Transmembrane protein n=1 Tax=Paramecium sonneborni TaxID=65129 RepID=A0A8S1QVM4_9CILI|nr:unnamed protein product [Paramecium sonneborni]
MNTEYQGFDTQNVTDNLDEFVYKISRNQQVLVFMLMTFFALIRLISILTQGKSYYALYGGGFLIYTILLLLISFKGKLWIKKYGNLLTCCVLGLMQIQAYQTNNIEELQQNQQLNIIFSMIIFSILDLKGAYFQIIVFIGIKIWIQVSQNTKFNSYTLIFQLLEAILVGIYVFYQQQGHKIRFSQECFEKQLFRFLPDLIQNQFLMFNLDKQSSSFNLRFKSDITSIKWDDSNAPTSNLRSFLRNCFYEDQSLEQYILSRNNLKDYNHNHYFTQNLNLQYFDHKSNLISLNYSECFLGEKYYLITFNEKKYDYLTDINNSLITCINRNQELTISFLRKQLHLISSAMIQKNQLQQLAKSKIHTMYFLGQFLQINSFSQIDPNIKDINLTKLLQLLVNLYCIAYKPIQIELQSDEHNDFYIKSNEELIQTFFQILCQLLIRLKANVLKNQLIFGQDQNNRKLFYIIIRTECYQEFRSQLYSNPFFQKIQRRLCPNLDILIQNQSVKFYLYKNYQPLEEIRELEDEII